MSEIGQDILNVSITSEQVSSSLSCSVCCEDYVLGESVFKLPCTHLFHAPCITTWLVLRTTCPVCRTQVKEDSPREVSTTTATIEDNSLLEMELPSDDDEFDESYDLDIFTDEEHEGELLDEFISEDEGVSETDLDDFSMEDDEGDLGTGVVASTPLSVRIDTDTDDEEGEEDDELGESFEVEFETDISFGMGNSTTITCSANSLLMSTNSDSSVNISMDID